MLLWMGHKEAVRPTDSSRIELSQRTFRWYGSAPKAKELIQAGWNRFAIRIDLFGRRRCAALWRPFQLRRDQSSRRCRTRHPRSADDLADREKRAEVEATL